MKATILFILGTVVLVGLLSWGYNAKTSSDDKKLEAMTSREVAIDRCTTDMATKFHIHPHMKIFINGSESAIPAEIGITETCMHSIHTHDATGTIHVESPVQKDFTVGDFFAVWGKDFSKNSILGNIAGSGKSVKFSVNGATNDQFENYVMHDKDEIEIRYE